MNLTIKHYLHGFSYKQHFYKQHQAELAKNQAKAKQDPEVEILLFETHLLSPWACILRNIL